MSSKHPLARVGQRVPPSWGFSVFFESRTRRRILAGDIWSCLEHLIAERLTRQQRPRANAHLWQGHEFYQGAQNPRFDSRPLLYYYAFLNVSKAFLLARGVKLPPRTRHGLSDPSANARRRLLLESQTVKVDAQGAKNDQLLPELIAALGATPANQSYRVLDLLAQIPGIHRTYATIGRGRTSKSKSKGKQAATIGQTWRKGPCFAPCDLAVLRDGKGAWVRLSMDATALDVRQAAALLVQVPAVRSAFTRVDSGTRHSITFETAVDTSKTADMRMATLSQVLRRGGIWSLLTNQGYRHYMGAIPVRYRLPQLASIYAAMFFLGSVTRYRPYDYDTILGGRYAWLVEEFLAMQPTQFLYLLASTPAGVDVVKPLAAV